MSLLPCSSMACCSSTCSSSTSSGFLGACATGVRLGSALMHLMLMLEPTSRIGCGAMSLAGVGGDFDGAKAYKDSKVCNMLTMQEFHRRYHEETGITFTSLYPGCIATTGLFREHIPLFRLLFHPFRKYITKGYVSEEGAGKRLAQVASDPSLTKSGVYWSWNKDSTSFENQLSQEASDAEKAHKAWEVSKKLSG